MHYIDSMNKVSIIIPVIRPKLLANLVSLIHKNAGVPDEQYEILAEEDTERIGAPLMVRGLVDRSQHDLVMFIGDDCEPQPNFLAEAIKTMKTFQGEWGLVGLNDIERPGNHAPAHWLGHKRLLKFTGGEFFNTEYIHQYCDNELYMWAYSLNRYRLNKLAKINHKHEGFKDKTKSFRENVDASGDKDIKRVYSAEVRDHDKKVFDRRKQLVIRKTYKCLPLGMRSGSSMLTGALSIMGMDAGQTVYSDPAWNAKGHWENMEMININMAILKAFNCTFEHPDLPEGFEDDPKMDPLYDRALKIEPFVIKHPITMATLPFWMRAFTVLPVFINRDPESVAKSLLKKHHHPLEEGRRIWKEYIAKMRNEVANGLAMAEFSYEDFILNPVPYIKQTFTAFGLDWMYDKSKEDELKEFVDPKLNHDNINNKEEKKKLKILITNVALKGCYGTETWTYAMAKELSKQHDVTVLSPYTGKMALKILKFCKVINSIDSTAYDLAIINHVDCWHMVPDNIFKIFTSHSKIYSIERPPGEAKYVVGTNEYIHQNVIRNGIDCERFKPTKINKELKNILYLSNPAYAKGRKIMEEACRGYNLITLDEETFDIENLINQADLVVSLGRGTLEAMACGKNVIYGDFRKDWMDNFKGGGLVTPDNYNDFKIGEWHKDRKDMTVQDLQNEFKKYNYKFGEFNREMILQDFNIVKTTKQYINIWTNSKKYI